MGTPIGTVWDTRGVLAGPNWEAGQRDSSCVPISPIMLWYIDRRPRKRSVCAGGVRWG